MTYFWVPNILCTLEEGKAVLNDEYKKNMSCAGACHSCGAFLGVDLVDTGKEHVRAFCIDLWDTRMAA
jgi:hypothetical protein